MILTEKQVQGVVDKFNDFLKNQGKKARVATVSLYPQVAGKNYSSDAYILIGYTSRVNNLNMTDTSFQGIFAGVDSAKEETDDYTFYSVTVDNKYNEEIVMYHYKQGYNPKLTK